MIRSKVESFSTSLLSGMSIPISSKKGFICRFRIFVRIIHKATIAEDREKLWDNKKVWQALESKGFQIMSGLDVIEYTLKAGEKDRIIDAIDTLSGYESNIEEVAKN